MSVLAISASGGRAMWYLSRGTGTVTLLLLTLSMVLGIVNVRRWRSERWPRFLLDRLHRNVSLLVLAVLVAHIITSVLDGFAPISLLDAVVPFVGSYRPIWLGLGALSLDLLVALTVTSLLRGWVGQRTWRAIHWTAYACWPVAVVHGLGTGTDTPVTWVLALTLGCIVAVLLAIAVRAVAGWPQHQGVRAAALTALALGALLLAVWLPRGPLGSGWARRAGTPTRLLAATGSAAPGAVAPSTRVPAAVTATAGSLAVPFQASLSGPVRQGPAAGGEIAVNLQLTLDGPGSRRLSVQIQGPPAQGGGVSMSASRVSLGTSTHPDLYRGSVRALNGNQLLARVSGADGRALDLQITVAIDPSGAQASGTVSAVRAGTGA